MESITILKELPGEVLKVSSNYRRFLAYPDSFWWIESGEGAIFSMQRTGNLIEKGILNKGPLTYLGTATPGSLIFGFKIEESDPIAILLMTHAETKWKKISLSDLLMHCTNNPQSIPEFSSHFDLWINQVISQVSYFALDEGDKVIHASSTIDLEPGEIVVPFKSILPEHKDDIVWIEVIDGALQIFNFESLSVTKEFGPYPMTALTWASTLSQTQIRGLTTKEAMRSPKFASAFQGFQSHALKLIEYNEMRRKELDLKRIEKKELLDEIAVDLALREMGSILQEEREMVRVSIEDPLFLAAQLIGKEMAMEFLPGAESNPKDTFQTRLKSICERSRVAMRQVTLKKGFWKRDTRSLLGFLKESDTPVAIINHNPKHYEIIDPVTKKRISLNESSFEKLRGFAFMFYKPFPEGPVSGSTILQFCLKGQKRESLTILAVGVLGGLISLFPPYFISILFNKVIGDAESSMLWQVIFGLVIVAISSSIFLLTRAFTMLRLSQLIDYKLESALWDRILSLSTNFFRQFTVGNLIERVYAISQIHQLVSGTTIKILLSAIFSLFYFFAMLFYSPLLALIGMGIIFFCLGLSAFCVIKKALLEKVILAISGVANGFVVQLIGGVAKLRISGAENKAFSKWSHYQKEMTSLEMQAQTMQNIVTLFTAVLPIFSTALLFSSVMWMMKDDNTLPITLGALIAFFAAFVPFSQAIFDVSNTLMNIIQAVPLWDRAKVILQATPEGGKEKAKPGKLTGDLLVDQLAFRYDKGSALVLDNVSLYANPGEFIAIVGPSGCGKTTLVRALLGFEIPEHGYIYYNSKELSGLDLREVRKQIGTVLQNGTIFSGTLYDNLVCGGLYSKEEVKYAIKVSGFVDDLKEMPMGLHTVVQSGGVTFSGGQAQRLLIARALIGKPKILIFDEATSALDNKTQDHVTARLDELKVTRIVIAHRMSTVKNANRIYVMEKGRIVQSGSFHELALQEGLFKIMLERQKL